MHSTSVEFAKAVFFVLAGLFVVCVTNLPILAAKNKAVHKWFGAIAEALNIGPVAGCLGMICLVVAPLISGFLAFQFVMWLYLEWFPLRH